MAFAKLLKGCLAWESTKWFTYPGKKVIAAKGIEAPQHKLPQGCIVINPYGPLILN